MKKYLLLTLCISFVLVPCIALAALPSSISYQGKLTDSGGTPLTGSYDFEFGLYNVQSGGSALWSLTKSPVQVVNGLYNVELSGIKQYLGNDTEYWLQIKVKLGGAGSFETLSPRVKLLPVPYAYDLINSSWAVLVGGGQTDLHIHSQGAVTAHATTHTPGGADRLYPDSIGGYNIINSSITGVDIFDGSIDPADVSFNYAASGSKGGAATLASDVSFNYAASSSKGGPATSIATGSYENIRAGTATVANSLKSGNYLNDILVSSALYTASGSLGQNSVGSYHIIDSTITSADIFDGTITSNDVGFNYAASSSKGGAATTADDVTFNYATSSSKGGPATSIATGAYENIRAGTATVALMFSGNIDAAKINPGSLPANVIASSVAVEAVGPYQLSGTGARTSGTFYRGDGQFVPMAGGGDMATGTYDYLGTIGVVDLAENPGMAILLNNQETDTSGSAAQTGIRTYVVSVADGNKYSQIMASVIIGLDQSGANSNSVTFELLYAATSTENMVLSLSGNNASDSHKIFGTLTYSGNFAGGGTISVDVTAYTGGTWRVKSFRVYGIY